MGLGHLIHAGGEPLDFAGEAVDVLAEGAVFATTVRFGDVATDD